MEESAGLDTRSGSSTLIGITASNRSSDACRVDAFILISAWIFPLFCGRISQSQLELWRSGLDVWLVSVSFFLDVIQKEGTWTSLIECSYDLSLLNNTPSKRNLWSVNPEVNNRLQPAGRLMWGWCVCLCVCELTLKAGMHHCGWGDW